LADDAALGLIRGGGTSNGRDGLAPAWTWSQHRAVWVSVDIDPARAPPPASLGFLLNESGSKPSP
jgi:hypothetical protein